MSNSWFQFKQFTIHQERCALKVCTDACLLGAWAVEKISQRYIEVNNILDIGAGTGLLSLMLAQKTTGVIDAIEINEAAAGQAGQNFSASPWAKRIFNFNTGIQEFSTDKKYDFIISNPPFFQNDLLSSDAAKNAAKHATTLTLATLLKAINFHLCTDGFAAILIPWHRTEYLKKLTAAQGLFINEMLFVKQTPAHDFFRSLILLSKKEGKEKTDALTIHEEQRQYSAGFTNLLKDYYLKL